MMKGKGNKLHQENNDKNTGNKKEIPQTTKNQDVKRKCKKTKMKPKENKRKKENNENKDEKVSRNINYMCIVLVLFGCSIWLLFSF